MYYVEQFLTMTNATVECAQMPNTRYPSDQNKFLNIYFQCSTYFVLHTCGLEINFPFK